MNSILDQSIDFINGEVPESDGSILYGGVCHFQLMQKYLRTISTTHNLMVQKNTCMYRRKSNMADH